MWGWRARRRDKYAPTAGYLRLRFPLPPPPILNNLLFLRAFFGQRRATPLFTTLFETRFRDTSGDRSGRSHPSLAGRPPGALPFSRRAGTPPTSARSLLRGSVSRTIVRRWIGCHRVRLAGAGSGGAPRRPRPCAGSRRASASIVHWPRPHGGVDGRSACPQGRRPHACPWSRSHAGAEMRGRPCVRRTAGNPFPSTGSASHATPRSAPGEPG